MKRIFHSEEGFFEYDFLRIKKPGKISISVKGGGKIIVKAGAFVSDFFMQKFLWEKRKWIFEKLNTAVKIKKYPWKRNSIKDFVENKEKALKFTHSKIGYFNKIYNFKFNKISIKNHKSRWGSCSGKGNLNFNYRIIFLEEELSDYIIVHELCHLKELNHSRKFWDLVKITIPNYKIINKKFKNIEI